jgi:hypothetical protein
MYPIAANKPNNKAAQVEILSQPLSIVIQNDYPETATNPTISPLEIDIKVYCLEMQALRKKATTDPAAPAIRVFAAIRPYKASSFEPLKVNPVFRKSQQG